MGGLNGGALGVNGTGVWVFDGSLVAELEIMVLACEGGFGEGGEAISPNLRAELELI